jgi:penicillin-binding protein 1A
MFIITIGLGVVFLPSVVLQHPIFQVSKEDLRPITQWRPKSNTVIFDRKGRKIGEQFHQYHIYTPYEQIPKDFIHSLIAIEDNTFWKHNGFDIQAIARVISQYFRGDSDLYGQGASTLTQQVVREFLLSREKNFTRKIREIVLAMALEKNLSKKKILEIYANQMFLGNGSYGVGAAAHRYFAKTVEELNLAEWSLIAGMFQSPSRYNPHRYPLKAKKRQLQVLKALERTEYITTEERIALSKAPLNYVEYQPLYGQVAPYFIDNVASEVKNILEKENLNDSGLKIYTSLDLDLQQIADQAMKENEPLFDEYKSRVYETFERQRNDENLIEASILVLDNKTGGIVSMVGGRDHQISQFNRAIDAIRSPGSAFKTAIYGLALKNGKSWNDTMYVAPITIGNYRPNNPTRDFLKESTLLKSFYMSSNSPAVSLGDELGIANVNRFASSLGVESHLKNEAGTLLGSSEVSMLDLARMYLTIANKGVKVDPVSVLRIEDSHGKVIYTSPEVSSRSTRVLDPQTSGLLIKGLSQVIERGTGYKARHLNGLAAGKTGTSNKSDDNWFCGFTNDLTIIAWVGNDQHNRIGGANASKIAVPLWASFAEKSIKHLKSSRLPISGGLISARVNPDFGNLDPYGVRMYFRPHQVPKKKTSDLAIINQGKKIRAEMF